MVEQRLGVFQVLGIEALGEPAVDFGKHRARFVAATGTSKQAGKVYGRAQLPQLGLLWASDIERRARLTAKIAGC